MTEAVPVLDDEESDSDVSEDSAEEPEEERLRERDRYRSRRKHPVRAKALSYRKIKPELLAKGAAEYPPEEFADIPRPKTRADCLPGGCNEVRPCPFVSCRHHLALDVTEFRAILTNFPDLEVEDMAHTCALDVADDGPVTLETVGILLNVTRERARQMEVKAMAKAQLVLARMEDLRDFTPRPGGSARDRYERLPDAARVKRRRLHVLHGGGE